MSDMDMAGMPVEAQDCYHLMAPGYDPVQAFWVCRTARRNPGVPVAFNGAAGGKAAAVAPGGWDGVIDFHDAS